MWLTSILLKISALCLALTSIVDKDHYSMLWAIGCYLVAVTV
jgi:hypothetical protein